MPLPSIQDVAVEHLFSDYDKLVAAGLPVTTIRHLERLRDIYNYWLTFPSKRDRDIVAELRSRYGLGDTVAREDLRLIKSLLGDFQRVSKDYMRYRVTTMLERAYEKAEASGNTRDMIAAAKVLKEVHRLDKDDERANVLDKLVPIRLLFTDDPAVIGLSRMPDYRNRIKAVKERYWVEATQDVDFEDIDETLDDLFKVNGNTGSPGIS